MVGSLSLRMTLLSALAACSLVSCSKVTGEIRPDPRDFYSDAWVISLIDAIEQEDLAKIDGWIAAGANVNAVGHAREDDPDRQEMTPLFWGAAGKQEGGLSGSPATRCRSQSRRAGTRHDR